MNQAARTINSTQLRRFAPLGKLSDEDAQELLRTSITIQLSPGTPVFRKDDADKQVFYLVKGKIEVRGESKKAIVVAGSKEARIPLGHHLPGQVSARALEESVLLSFDADMLDLFLNWTNPNAYVVNEVETSKDHEWMNRLLQSRGLLRFSDSQIHTLLDRMNEIQVKAGDAIVTQDDAEDYYYFIKKGKATVSRKPDANAKDIKLAELREGDAFGEESILTSTPRAATITMQEDGSLMRLSKQDFSEFLAQPLLTTISWDESVAKAAAGAVYLDIRLEEEFKTLNIPGSINIPLPLLRLKLKALNKSRKYIVYCDDASRSSVAAFLLNRHGFDAFILEGGMTTAIPHLALKKVVLPEQEAETTPTETETTIEPQQEQAPTEAKETEQTTVEKTEQGHDFCSLADYWGATVDDAPDDMFADSDTLHNIEKTKVTASTPTKKETPTITEKPAFKNNPAARPTVAPITLPQSNPYGTSHFFRNSTIVLCILGFMATAGIMQFSAESTTTTTPVSTSHIVEQQITSPTKATPIPNVAPPPATQNNDNRDLVTQAIQMDMMIEATQIEESAEIAEVVEYQPTVTLEPAAQQAIDPATRGFIE